jgi:hypothetical protein
MERGSSSPTLRSLSFHTLSQQEHTGHLNRAIVLATPTVVNGQALRQLLGGLGKISLALLLSRDCSDDLHNANQKQDTGQQENPPVDLVHGFLQFVR